MFTKEMAVQKFVLPYHTRVVGVGKRPDSLLGRVLVGRPSRSRATARQTIYPKSNPTARDDRWAGRRGVYMELLILHRNLVGCRLREVPVDRP